jgi:hypothetical protein
MWSDAKGRFVSRFFFHIIDGRLVIPDDEGMELSDVFAAQVEALASARDIAMAGASRDRRMILAVDDSGAVVNSAPVFSN